MRNWSSASRASCVSNKCSPDEGALGAEILGYSTCPNGAEERLKSLEKDPATRWRHRRFRMGGFQALRANSARWPNSLATDSSAHAPWIVVEGVDSNYRNLTAGRTLLAAMRERLDQKPVKANERPHSSAAGVAR